jgi:hypothetical protein
VRRAGLGLQPARPDRGRAPARHRRLRARHSLRLAALRSLLALLALCAGSAAAQDLEPRAYANTPVGMNFAIAGYAYSSGDVATDSAVLEDGNVRINAALLAYARSLDVLGCSGKVDVILPYAWEEGTASFMGEPAERSVRGHGDPRVRFSVNFYGAPALSLEEFAAYEQDLIAGASLQIVAPLGQYEQDKLLNVGTNRWTFRPQIGVSKRFDPLIVELSLTGSFYTDNHDFFDGHEREQDPVYSGQVHVIYAFRSGLWGSVDYTYYRGGKVQVDGVGSDDLQSNSRLGATLAVPLNKHNSLKLFASRGVSVRYGGDYDTIGVAWQVRWGGGL